MPLLIDSCIASREKIEFEARTPSLILSHRRKILYSNTQIGAAVILFWGEVTVSIVREMNGTFFARAVQNDAVTKGKGNACAECILVSFTTGHQP